MNALFDFDLVQIPSGEILSVVGNFKKDYFRGRLTYVPDSRGDILINGRRYSKIGGRFMSASLPQSEKLLSLPGEEHYMCRTSSIVNYWSPKDGVKVLVGKELDNWFQFQNHISSLELKPVKLGLTGSTAIGSRQPHSDFDIVVYCDDPDPLKKLILNCYDHTMPFTRDFVTKKYSSYKMMSAEDIWRFMKSKWKYINIGGTSSSINFVDSSVFHDELLHPPACSQIIESEGEIQNSKMSNYAFCSVSIRHHSEMLKLHTPLYFYRGGFSDGDRVLFRGGFTRQSDQPYILVDGNGTFIRPIDH